jgi:hypothetical protein
MTSLPDLNQV